MDVVVDNAKQSNRHVGGEVDKHLFAVDQVIVVR